MLRRSSPQDISWFLDLRRNKQIDMDPPYQRRSVWNPKDRRFFLDTVFRGYPCPPIFLHKTLGPSQETIYAVVDGKQRLQTLFLFVDGQIALAEDFGDDRFNGKTWPLLGQDEKKAFWDYVIPVEFLTFDVQDTRVVSQAFDRLNRNMRKLEPQELRHARWDGWFIKLVERECEAETWKDLGVVTNARSKRMKDAQFISELLLVIITHRQHGFDQDSLDEAYARFDDIDEADETIAPDEVEAEVEAVKAYLVQMQQSNGCVRPNARALAHFYSLWTLIALHRAELPQNAATAAKYAEFISMVGELKDSPNSAALLNGESGTKYALANEYLQAYGGASTDLAPRAKRLDALRTFMRGA